MQQSAVGERIVDLHGNVAKVGICHHLSQKCPYRVGHANKELPGNEVHWGSLSEFKRLTLLVQRNIARARAKVYAIIVNGVSDKAKKVKKLRGVRRRCGQLRAEQAIVY